MTSSTAKSVTKTSKKNYYGKYGLDRRKEIAQCTPEVQAASKCVVAFIHKDLIDPRTLNTSIRVVSGMLSSPPYHKQMKFLNQPTPAYCSGFLLDEEHVVTAGHVDLGNIQDENYRVVFGFTKNAPRPNTIGSNQELIFDQSQVFKIKGVERKHFDYANNIDYQIIELDRPAIGVGLPCKISTLGVKEKDKVYMVGHPNGLPQKYSGLASISKVIGTDCFYAPIESFKGNSGSPIFNESNEVVGIMSSGPFDTKLNGDGLAVYIEYSRKKQPHQICTNILHVKDDFDKLTGKKDPRDPSRDGTLPNVHIGNAILTETPEVGNLGNNYTKVERDSEIAFLNKTVIPEEGFLYEKIKGTFEASKSDSIFIEISKFDDHTLEAKLIPDNHNLDQLAKQNKENQYFVFERNYFDGFVQIYADPMCELASALSLYPRSTATPTMIKITAGAYPDRPEQMTIHIEAATDQFGAPLTEVQKLAAKKILRSNLQPGGDNPGAGTKIPPGRY
jgi:V8-like Glu-specific endopeptidase